MWPADREPCLLPLRFRRLLLRWEAGRQEHALHLRLTAPLGFPGERHCNTFEVETFNPADIGVDPVVQWRWLVVVASNQEAQDPAGSALHGSAVAGGSRIFPEGSLVGFLEFFAVTLFAEKLLLPRVKPAF
ncbi:hypothetical protein HPB48_007065 [Haemaphysalis longicornis]|uniref:Uncharacterized protein n=1 Tax=Haemaphysalis longicornis TaxID=44386 RepID=A0A9J6G103_HAELO|nr:hypothetical protein HPB48_007065 [Haemaphysalis longicornis]